MLLVILAKINYGAVSVVDILQFVEVYYYKDHGNHHKP